MRRAAGVHAVPLWIVRPVASRRCAEIAKQGERRQAGQRGYNRLPVLAAQEELADLAFAMFVRWGLVLGVLLRLRTDRIFRIAAVVVGARAALVGAFNCRFVNRRVIVHPAGLSAPIDPRAVNGRKQYGAADRGNREQRGQEVRRVTVHLAGRRGRT